VDHDRRGVVASTLSKIPGVFWKTPLGLSSSVEYSILRVPPQPIALLAVSRLLVTSKFA